MTSGSIVLYKTDIPMVSEVIHSFFKGDSSGRVLYLVDNSPTDDLKVLKELYPNQIDYIFCNANLGYGKAHNIAIRKSIEAGQKYHVVLNPDLSFESETIKGLEQFMDDNPDVGACIPDMTNQDGTRCYSSKLLPSVSIGVYRRFLPNSSKTKRLNEEYHLKFADNSKVFDIPSISGCFMFLRISALKEVGLFDERFFMYYEDIDFSRRIRKKFRVSHVPTVHAMHISGKAAYKSKKMLMILVKNGIKYFNKYHWFFDFEGKRMNEEALRSVPRLK